MQLNTDVEWIRLAMILVVWAAAWFGIRALLRKVRLVLVEHSQDDERDKRITTVVRAIKHVLSVIMVAVVVMLVLAEFGVSIAPLLGAAGVAGIAVGLAAQGLAKDFIRGFSLLVDDQIRVGDAVEIAGKSGVVEEVTTRCITLRDYDGTVHFVPAGQIQTVTNRSYGFAYATLDVGVASYADFDQATQVMREVADELRADPKFKSQIVEPIDIAGVDQWAESSVVIKARIKVAPGAQAGVRREMLRRLKLRFDRDGIELPVQQVTFVTPRGQQVAKPAGGIHR
jgi:small-conductance mechanosensitive channel